MRGEMLFYNNKAVSPVLIGKKQPCFQASLPQVGERTWERGYVKNYGR